MRWRVTRFDDWVRAVLPVVTLAFGQLGCSSDSRPRPSPDAGARPSPSYTIELSPADAVFDMTSNSLDLWVTDVPGTCDYLNRAEVKANARLVGIMVMGAAVGQGTYEIDGDLKIAFAEYFVTDETCTTSLGPAAEAGSTVILDWVGTDEVVGSYALDFQRGEERVTLTGDFFATPCELPYRPNSTCVQ